MITPELATFLEAGPTLQLATRDESLIPECALVSGHVLLPDRRTLRVYVPKSAAGRTVRNLDVCRRAAVVAAHPVDHRSVQMKGDVVAVAEVSEPDDPAFAAYLDAHAALLELVGMPRALVRRIAWWPAVAVDVRVTDLFDHTPGPGAGERLREGAP